jgi:hypothetical protein
MRINDQFFKGPGKTVEGVSMIEIGKSKENVINVVCEISLSKGIRE